MGKSASDGREVDACDDDDAAAWSRYGDEIREHDPEAYADALSVLAELAAKVRSRSLGTRIARGRLFLARDRLPSA